MKKIIFIIVLLFTLTLMVSAVEKIDTVNKVDTVSFSNLFNAYKTMPFARLMQGASEYSTSKSISSSVNLFKTGVNLLVNGIVWGITGSILLGIGFVMVNFYAEIAGVSFSTALAAIFINGILETSEYAYMALGFIVSGVIMSIFILLIVPGIILMVIGSMKKASIFKPLKESVGFSIKLGYNL